METKEYRTIDREALGWPSGEWDSEPDKIQWPDEETGLPCLAVRNHRAGYWCGYVGVDESHPFYGKDYSNDDVRQADGELVDVHGGLTFSDKCHPGETEGQGICHVASPGEPDHVWWFGFDCAHLGDCSPYDMTEQGRRWRDPMSDYRSLEYVKGECRHLARQLAAHRASR